MTNPIAMWGSFFAALCLAVAVSGQSTDQPPYTNPDLPAERRAADLVSRMTLDEKVLQMQNSAPALPRLGIPAYDWWNEALHGVARAGQATVFPQAIGLAATWDTDLMHRVADVISTEARAKYNEAIRNNDHSRYHGLTFWSPNINIFRDPRWGRGQETYGEDPYLTSRHTASTGYSAFLTVATIRRISSSLNHTSALAWRSISSPRACGCFRETFTNAGVTATAKHVVERHPDQRKIPAVAVALDQAE